MRVKKYLISKLKQLIFEILAEKEQEKIAQFRKSIIGETYTLSTTCRIVNRQVGHKKIKIGQHSVIEGELMIMGYGGNIEIGEYTYIGKDSRIWSGDSITIGNHVLISHNVNIMDTNSHSIDHLERATQFKNLIHNGYAKKNNNIINTPIKINDHVWINYNVVIQKGVTIGTGAIIAPNSVVTKNIDDYTLVGGIPARVLKKLK